MSKNKKNQNQQASYADEDPFSEKYKENSNAHE